MTNTNCWVAIPENSDFSIHNIPFGIFSDANHTKRVGIAIGEQLIDLSKAAELGVFNALGFDTSVFTLSLIHI